MWNSGTVGRINKQQMGPLYHYRRFQDTIQVYSPSFLSSDKSESVFFPVTARRDLRTSPEMGSGKGTSSGNSWFLFLLVPCTKKEWKVMSGNRSFADKSIHKKQPFKRETVKSVCQLILAHDWTVSIDLTDAYLHVPIHP